MSPAKLPCSIVVLAALALGCAEPCATCRIAAYRGKHIGELMKDRALEPRAVLPDEAGNRMYVFEVTYLTWTSLPPSGPVTPQDLGNTPGQVQLNPSTRTPAPSTAPGPLPGTAAVPTLTQVPVVAVRILRVRTTAEGIILNYSSKAS